MERIKKFIARIIEDNILMQKIFKIALIILFIFFLKVSYELYVIRQEIAKNQAEREKLERWPFD